MGIAFDIPPVLDEILNFNTVQIASLIVGENSIPVGVPRLRALPLLMCRLTPRGVLLPRLLEHRP